MVAATAPSPSVSDFFPHEMDVTSVASAKMTRKSIKKYFPLGQIMSQGKNNPITLHSVNETAFACLWSFMAEVMVVDGELPRSTKEAVALLVSSKNECPMCCSAHRMMGAAAQQAEKNSKMSKAEKEHKEELYMQCMDYAEILILDTINFRVKKTASIHKTDSSTAQEKSTKDFSLLNDAAKAEIALVVVLFFHMNRIISAVLGEQMSKAMFSVPEGAAKRMEAPSVMKVINKLMAPFLAGSMKAKREPGISNPLFPKGSSALHLMPKHLLGAEVAGAERAHALERLVQWSRAYEKYLLKEGVVSQEVIELLDNPSRAPPDGLRPAKVSQWATTTMRKLIRVTLRKDEYAQDIANILCLVSYSPQSVYHSTCWQSVVDTLGDDQAKTIVVWWSMRECIKRAQGLSMPKRRTSH